MIQANAKKIIKRRENLEVTFQHAGDLPDCVISDIFSKLSMKDLVKTSILSKRWLNELGSRMDLNFDLCNMFDINTPQELQSFFKYSFLEGKFRHFDEVQCEFAYRVDQFMLHYQGSKIHSLRVIFPLGNEHHHVIDRMIFQGIAKGAEQIELLFSNKVVNGLFRNIKPYQFSYSFLSSCDSLKYLHLKHCLLAPPIYVSEFKKLRTIVLDQVVIEQDLLQGLFSSCFHLVNLTLKNCEFKSDLNITCPTLCHLNIVHFNRGAGVYPLELDIIALSLSSFEYGGNHQIHSFNIKAPQLSKFTWKCFLMPPIEFSELKNLRTVLLDGIFELSNLLPSLFCECVQLEVLTFNCCTFPFNLNITSPTLCHLNITDCHYMLPLSSKIDIDALNLKTFSYRGHMMISSIKAPRLCKLYLDSSTEREEEISGAFDFIASLHQLENLAMTMHLSQMARLPRILGPFQHLRQLEFYIDKLNEPDENLFWVLAIVMACPNLQKLFLTIRHPRLFECQRQRREYIGFFHNELKYVELRGCAGNMNEIELISHLLKYVSSLEQIIFGRSGIFYLGDGKWNEDFDWFPQARDLIQMMLKDEVNERCRLLFL